MFERLVIGSSVATQRGCEVRVASGDDDSDAVTLSFGPSHGSEFELSLDLETLGQVVRLGADALARTGRGFDPAQPPLDESADPSEIDFTPTVTAPAIEVVVARDPDGLTEIQVFVDGSPRSVAEYRVDAGAGWTWTDWTRARDDNLANASPAARAALREVYANPPGGRYICGRGNAGWLDVAPSDTHTSVCRQPPSGAAGHQCSGRE
ncbi:hypothetical protein ABZV58_06860 [Nocardia sp. NPDC004654]|uniref:hypothetical protein n=1 Tax=Nocardia sp. NPDC004654 TaxID=3154776 RepID=UPI0033B9714A